MPAARAVSTSWACACLSSRVRSSTRRSSSSLALAQGGLGALDVGVQPRVLDGDGGLRGEVPQQRDARRGEGLGGEPVLQVQHPDNASWRISGRQSTERGCRCARGRDRAEKGWGGEASPMSTCSLRAPDVGEDRPGQGAASVADGGLRAARCLRVRPRPRACPRSAAAGRRAGPPRSRWRRACSVATSRSRTISLGDGLLRLDHGERVDLGSRSVSGWWSRSRPLPRAARDGHWASSCWTLPWAPQCSVRLAGLARVGLRDDGSRRLRQKCAASSQTRATCWMKPFSRAAPDGLLVRGERLVQAAPEAGQLREDQPLERAEGLGAVGGPLRELSPVHLGSSSR